MKEGSWTLWSASDPRWRAHGSGSVGMFGVPADAQRHINKLKEELKEDPPKDLEFSYMKD